jgi:prolyl 4-hydroxylase
MLIMPVGTSIKQQVDQLAAEGKVAVAAELLKEQASAGEPDALFVLGAWLDSGQHLPRDRTQARLCFERAATAGHAQADVIFTNFLGNGTGGPRQWQAALVRLRKRASQDVRAKVELELLERMALDDEGNPATAPAGRELSKSPRLWQFPQLFTGDECNYLSAFATPFLQPATVIDNATGKAIRNPIRTSHTAQLTPPLENLVVHALNRRLAAATDTDVGQGEPLQVLRYLPGQEYKPHIDAIPSLENQRVLTALVYLNDGFEGGATRFIATGLSGRGRCGGGLVFRNVDDEGRPDKQAAHCGMPVTRGVKLLASRWIRERSYEPD